MKQSLMLKPSYWASVSGGKDSLYMLNLILNNLDQYPLNGVVHFELEIDYPFVKDVIDRMESMCKRLGVPFYRLEPRKSWQELYEKMKMPTRKIRWCNTHYKLDCQKQLNEILKSCGCYSVMYIGFCVDEVKRFKYEPFDRDGVRQIYPLAEMNIKEATIWEWAKQQEIFNDYYIYNKRCGCMYCPMSRLDNLKYLYRYYPDNFQKYIEMCRETEVFREKELGRPFSVRSSNPKYNADYTEKRIKEMVNFEDSQIKFVEVLYDT